MKVYIGNASIQRREFRYRIPEVKNERIVQIPPMSQIVLPDDFNTPQIEALVQANEQYGLASVDEVKTSRVKRRFTRLCYSVDRQISSFTIQSLFDNNQTTLTLGGKELRQQMAIAANDSVVRTLEEQKKQGNIAPDTDVDNFEMVIQEQETSDMPKKDEDMISEGVKVVDNKKPEKRRRKR